MKTGLLIKEFPGIEIWLKCQKKNRKGAGLLMGMVELSKEMTHLPVSDYLFVKAGERLEY